MTKKLIIFLAFLLLIPLTALSDCTEQCYTSECEITDACEMVCEDNVCRYYDGEGACWKYDKDKGYYPCGCKCYKCNDSCEDDYKCKDCNCGNCGCKCNDCDDDYSCFIRVIM